MTTFSNFTSWTKDRAISTLGTNCGSVDLPFQGWRRFKEAFAPELVGRAIASSNRQVAHCIDPFGGSGTTALACQFHNVASSTIEVNPYLADLISAKVASYDCDRIASELGEIVRTARRLDVDFERYRALLPSTFVQPGHGGKWLFSESTARRIYAIMSAIDVLPDPMSRRLFRVLLGGVLIELSNVVTSGKGRRYRKGKRAPTSTDVDAAFISAVQRAAGEIYTYRKRPPANTTVRCADARTAIWDLDLADLAVFSPPYCNSFDYTDIYNVELWMLGYLRASSDNIHLRTATLSSHVQCSREFPAAPKGSSTLSQALHALNDERERLWDRRIPEMVGAYFADMILVLSALRSRLHSGSSVWLVVADSRYAEVDIRVAAIITELAPHVGFELETFETFRTIRTSAQQGAQFSLEECLLVMQCS